MITKQLNDNNITQYRDAEPYAYQESKWRDISLLAASLSFFCWRSSRSRFPSISASVSLFRRRIPSADGVTGIYWIN